MLWELPDSNDVLPEVEVEISFTKLPSIFSPFILPVAQLFGDQWFAGRISPVWRCIVNGSLLCILAPVILFFLASWKRILPSSEWESGMLLNSQGTPLSPKQTKKYYFPYLERRIIKCAMLIFPLLGLGWVTVYAFTGKNPIPRLFFIEEKTKYQILNHTEFTIKEDDKTGNITVSFILDFKKDNTLPTDILLEPVELRPPAKNHYKLDSVTASTSGKNRKDARRTPATDPDVDFKQYLGLLNNNRIQPIKIQIRLIHLDSSKRLTHNEVKESIHVVINEWNSKSLGK